MPSSPVYVAGVPSRERFVVGGSGLRLHLVEWGEGERVVLLLHGFLEHAHVWDWVAPRLAAAGYRAAALDWRGHGDSDWVGPGGYYHFADYVGDLGAVVRALGGRAAIVAHSMGASAALLYAGTEPERMRALACVDALGPPDMPPASAPARFATWIADVGRVHERGRRALASGDPAARLRERFPRFPVAAAEQLAAHGTRMDDGVRVWKFDPLHQTTSPQPYYVAQAREFWRRIACPVLYVDGAESGLRLDTTDLAERLAILRARHVTVDAAGHHPHVERPEAFAEVIVRFLAATR
jgi:pimeloyl-ACP methyl ester carboxylesterase